MGRVTVRRKVVAVDLGGRPDGRSHVLRQDTLAVEEPLEVRVAGRSYTTTMRTPGHDVELVHGFLSAEGVIAGPDDIVTVRYCEGAVATGPDGLPQNTYNLLDVALRDGVAPPTGLERAALTSSSCGVCGTATIEALRVRQPFDLRADTTPVDAATVLALPERLREEQSTFASTGGLHAAGLFTADGELLVAREDVGRHNAVDKVLGWAMLEGHRPATGCVLMVSGRTSFELAQKAVLAGVPVLAGVSAPSSLAVEVADDAGLTLAGFVRGDRMNVYTHPDRIRLP